jgi:Ca2+-binding RTX toxin-like protein
MATLTGTAGNDIFVLKAFGKDTVVEALNQGTDLVKASFDHTLASNVENLTLLNNNVMLQASFGPGDVVALARPADPTRAIVGSWQIDDDAGRSVITFLSDGTYMHVQNGPTQGLGHSGVEVGKYTWNASSGAITIGSLTADTNGDWGFSDGAPTTAFVDGNSLTASFAGEGSFMLTRVEGSGSALVGSWYDWNAPEAKGIAVVTFFADGTYMYGQDGSSVLDPSGHDGMEYGTYQYNSSTGLVTYNTLTDTSGEWGLSVPSDPGGSFTALVRGANGTGNALANTLAGDGSANQLSGLGGNDILRGNGGSDRLLGGGGADKLYGGAGRDTLNGGAGADKFYFDTTPGSSADSIVNWDANSDKIVLDDDIYTLLGSGGLRALSAGNFHLGQAADADDYIIYDTFSGRLYYDADGNGDGQLVTIATLSTKPVLTASDILITG